MVSQWNSKIYYQLTICLSSFLFTSVFAKGRLFKESQFLPIISHDPEDVKFFLFPPNSDPRNRQEIKYLDNSSLMRSSFIPNAVTVIIFNGLASIPNYVFQENIQDLINGYVSSGIHANFIGVNWNKLSTLEWYGAPMSQLDFSRYLDVLNNTHIVSKRAAEFTCWLVRENMITLNHIHFIGASIGAIVSAMTGRKITQLTGGGRVRRITGLDPGGGLFDPPYVPDPGPTSGDAMFTDVFHSNSGYLGNSLEKAADMNIIVNNGVFQPGCGQKSFNKMNQCSHNFAVTVYTTSIRNALIACECPPWRRIAKQCEHPCLNPTVVGPYLYEKYVNLSHV